MILESLTVHTKKKAPTCICGKACSTRNSLHAHTSRKRQKKKIKNTTSCKARVVLRGVQAPLNQYFSKLDNIFEITRIWCRICKVEYSAKSVRGMRNHLRAHPEKGVDSKFRQFALVSESKKNAETYLRRKLAEQEELRGVMARSLGKLPGPHLDPYIARSLDF